MTLFTKPAIVRSSTILGVSILLLVAALNAPIGPWLERSALFQKSFVVQQVSVTGLDRTLRAQFDAAADVRVGMSLIGLDLQAMRDRLLALPWVADAIIQRQLAGSLSIEIRERIPLALWQIDGLVYVIDQTGVAIATGTLDGYEHLPLVVGRGANGEAYALFQSLSVLSNMPASVQSAVRVAERRWNIHFDNDVVVKLPEEGDDLFALENAWLRLVALQRKHRLMEREVEIIDLRQADRLVLGLTARGKRVLAGQEWRT